LNDETRGLIGVEELSLLPSGALLVNTARGEVLDEPALLDSLEQGHLAGVALDVIWHERDEERRPSDLLRYARTHPNLLITPHIGGATFESMSATEIFMARKLQTYLEKIP
jgi:phosphoglycerate dehydrogenase-like enzyme